ncbi:MAG: DUF1772 domain-containing protein [Ilumatobacter sp.]
MTLLDDPTPPAPSGPAPEPSPAGSTPIRAPRTDRLAGIAVIVATVLTGLFAGFFLTYSASVVLGLAQVDDLTYVRSFQAINATIRNATFAVFFFGCVPSILWALVANRAGGRTNITLLAFALTACAAVVVITFAGSVPLNDDLATYVDLDAASAAAERGDFESTWNRLNLVRSVLAVAGLVAVASVRSARPDRSVASTPGRRGGSQPSRR